LRKDGRLYVVGGRQRRGDLRDVDEWHHYECAVVLEVDLDTHEVFTVFEWETPPEARPSVEPSIVFKAASLSAGRLFLCTQTEVLVVSPPSFEVLHRISLPCFNDLHHVRPTASGTIMVVSTGLDMVFEVTLEGAVVAEAGVAPGVSPWTRFSRDIDYRKVPTTQPHDYHPNFVFSAEDEVWVTRCKTSDVLSLTSPGRPPVPTSLMTQIHDGVEHEQSVWFSGVEGDLVALDRNTLKVVSKFDLREAAERTPLGWTRGLAPLGAGVIAVGFSRLRPTRWRARISAAKRMVGGYPWGSAPTRVARFDLGAKRLLDEIDLEPHGLNAIFSLHRVSGDESLVPSLAAGV
jgi:hypothetical protein